MSVTATVVAIEFLAPVRLWLLVVVGGLAVGYVATVRWRRTAQLRFTRVDLLAGVAPRRPAWRRHVVAVLQVLGLSLAVVALAQPVDRTTERPEMGGRVAVLFDVSLSMMATDVQPDRFRAAQEAAREFVDEIDPTVEIALVSFAGEVTIEVPPTLDRARLAAGIDALELAPATAIGDALVAGVRLLERSATEDDESLGAIVLLTDGETTVGRPTLEGAQWAAEAGVPVFAISFGTPFGAILDPGGSGELIPVPVRPDVLDDVAALTGGTAHDAATAEELAAAYDDIRDSLGTTLGEPIDVITEHTWRWALAAFVTLSLAWGLGLWWLRGLV